MIESRLLQYILTLLALLCTIFLFIYKDTLDRRKGSLPGMSFSSPPVADFVANQINFGVRIMAVRFTDLSTGEITHWNWDFNNDGLVDSNERHPAFLFSAPGKHTVKLTIEGPGGRAEITKHIHITLTGTGPCPLPPVAAFTASTTSGVAPLEVEFIDQAGGDITTWHWDFDGDGTTDSTEQNPTFIYSTPGKYDVRLTVTGPTGSDSITRHGYIQVK